MKRLTLLSVLLAMFSFAAVMPAFSQAGALGTVKGVVKDDQGTPIPDAQVVWHNDDNGRVYKLKTNKKGEYFSLGIEPGKYTVTATTKEGKQVFSRSNENVQVEEHELNIDVQAEKQQQIKDTAKQTGLTPEQIQQKLEEQKKVESYNANIKQVNEKLRTANTDLAAQPPNYDGAIASLNEATQMAPNEGLVWFRLGSVYLDSAAHQTDPSEKTKRTTEAYNDLKKAIDLDKGSEQQNATGQPAKKPEEVATDKARSAAYYSNFGSAAARMGKGDEAVDAYKKAIELDPPHAASYYFNLGVVLHNTAKDADQRKQAMDAFDKAIAADPNKADAYYLKGTDGIALATQDSSGKLIPPPGTAEAFQKYLELQPNGSHAEECKQMLAALNATVETGFGKKSTPKKK